MEELPCSTTSVKKLTSEPYVGEKEIDFGFSGLQVCEHVSFNQHIREAGGTVYIQPKKLSFELHEDRLTPKIMNDLHVGMTNSSMEFYYRGFPLDAKTKDTTPIRSILVRFFGRLMCVVVNGRSMHA